MMRARKNRSYMGRGLTLLVVTALAGALAIPFVFLLLLVLSGHYFFIGVASAAYLFGSWVGGVAAATLIAGILLRIGAHNEASLGFEEVSDESQKKPPPVAFNYVAPSPNGKRPHDISPYDESKNP